MALDDRALRAHPDGPGARDDRGCPSRPRRRVSARPLITRSPRSHSGLSPSFPVRPIRDEEQLLTPISSQTAGEIPFRGPRRPANGKIPGSKIFALAFGRPRRRSAFLPEVPKRASRASPSSCDTRSARANPQRDPVDPRNRSRSPIGFSYWETGRQPRIAIGSRPRRLVTSTPTSSRSRRMRGAPGGRQFAVDLVTTEYVLYLDDDAELFPGTIDRMVADLDNHPEALATGARVVLPRGPARVLRRPSGRTKRRSSLRSRRRVFRSRIRSRSRPCDWVSGTAFPRATRGARPLSDRRPDGRVLRRQRMVLSRSAVEPTPFDVAPKRSSFIIRSPMSIRARRPKSARGSPLTPVDRSFLSGSRQSSRCDLRYGAGASVGKS